MAINYLKESLARYAQTDRQEYSLNRIEKMCKSLGIGITYGTSVGKSPQAVILDHTYQGSEIRVGDTGYVKIKGEEFGDWRDDYLDPREDIDWKAVKTCLKNNFVKAQENNNHSKLNVKPLKESNGMNYFILQDKDEDSKVNAIIMSKWVDAKKVQDIVDDVMYEWRNSDDFDYEDVIEAIEDALADSCTIITNFEEIWF